MENTRVFVGVRSSCFQKKLTLSGVRWVFAFLFFKNLGFSRWKFFSCSKAIFEGLRRQFFKHLPVIFFIFILKSKIFQRKPDAHASKITTFERKWPFRTRVVNIAILYGNLRCFLLFGYLLGDDFRLQKASKNWCRSFFLTTTTTTRTTRTRPTTTATTTATTTPRTTTTTTRRTRTTTWTATTTPT